MGTIEPPSDVVIGAAYGYAPEQVAPFLESLKATGYTGRVALVVTRDQVAAYGRDELFNSVDLIAVRPLRPPLKLVRQSGWSKLLWFPYEGAAWLLMRLLGPFGRRSLTLRRSIIRRCFKPHLARFLEYQEYIVAHDFDRILMSDVRDVVFQRNPSDWMATPGLSVSIEVDRYTIGTEPTNAAWIAGLYGEDGLAQLRDRNVSCSGLSWGDRASVDHYLQLMADEMLMTRFVGPWVGCDQGYHNWLLWTDQLGHVELQPALQSEVATLSLFDLAELDIDAEGWLRNRDGSVPGVIHMYDRVSGLDSRLAALMPNERRES